MNKTDKIIHYLKHSSFSDREIARKVDSSADYVRYLAYRNGISLRGRCGRG